VFVSMATLMWSVMVSATTSVVNLLVLLWSIVALGVGVVLVAHSGTFSLLLALDWRLALTSDVIKLESHLITLISLGCSSRSRLVFVVIAVNESSVVVGQFLLLKFSVFLARLLLSRRCCRFHKVCMTLRLVVLCKCRGLGVL